MTETICLDSPSVDLAEIYEWFTDLEQTMPETTRRQLVHRIILHPATKCRLYSALRIVLKERAMRRDLREDVLQGAMLILIERLTARTLPYQNEGLDRFGGWLFRICHSACADAWKYNRPLWLHPIPAIQVPRLSQFAVDPEKQPAWDRLTQALDTVVDDLLRDVLLEWIVNRIRIRESATRRGVSLGTMHNLRQRGIAALRENDH